MGKIWKSIVARISSWLTPDHVIPLKPGTCECEHMRCGHVNGVGKCNCWWAPDGDSAEWRPCACQMFILDDDDDGGGEDDTTPSPEDLEKLYHVR